MSMVAGNLFRNEFGVQRVPLYGCLSIVNKFYTIMKSIKYKDSSLFPASDVMLQSRILDPLHSWN